MEYHHAPLLIFVFSYRTPAQTAFRLSVHSFVHIDDSQQTHAMQSNNSYCWDTSGFMVRILSFPIEKSLTYYVILKRAALWHRLQQPQLHSVAKNCFCESAWLKIPRITRHGKLSTRPAASISKHLIFFSYPNWSRVLPCFIVWLADAMRP